VVTLVSADLTGAAIKNGLRPGLPVKIACKAPVPLDAAGDIGELKA